MLTAAGYLLKSEYQVVGRYVDAASKIILGLIVLTYLWRLVSGGSLGARMTARRPLRQAPGLRLPVASAGGRWPEVSPDSSRGWRASNRRRP